MKKKLCSVLSLLPLRTIMIVKASEEDYLLGIMRFLGRAKARSEVTERAEGIGFVRLNDASNW
jgi:hypothetical protein